MENFGNKNEKQIAERVPTEHEIEFNHIALFLSEEDAKDTQRGQSGLSEEIVPVTYNGQTLFVRYCRTNHHGEDIPAYVCTDGGAYVVKMIPRT